MKMIETPSKAGNAACSTNAMSSARICLVTFDVFKTLVLGLVKLDRSSRVGAGVCLIRKFWATIGMTQERYPQLVKYS